MENLPEDLEYFESVKIEFELKKKQKERELTNLNEQLVYLDNRIELIRKNINDTKNIRTICCESPHAN